MMALWDYHVFLGEQVLNSILRNDVLHLKKGGEEAGAGSLLTRSSVGTAKQGARDTTGSCKHTPWEGWFGKTCSSPKWGLGGGHSQLRCSAAAHLVVRGYQMLYCLAICCGDLLDVGGFLLPQPSQL